MTKTTTPPTSKPYFQRFARTRMVARRAIKLGDTEYKVAGKLEEKVLTRLHQHGVRFEYEPGDITFTQPAEKKRYKLDVLLSNGIIIEAKGEFDSKARKKHKLLKEQYPDLDVRFAFSSPGKKIGKKSKTTYAMWCEAHGFKYTGSVIPVEWMNEAPDPKRIAAAKAALKVKD